MVRPLWQVLVHATQDDEPLSCDECYVLVDYLADLLAEGIHSKQVVSLADRYLDGCRDCDAGFVYKVNHAARGTEVRVAEDAAVERAEDLTQT